MLVVTYRIGSRNCLVNVTIDQLPTILAELQNLGATDIVVSR